MLSHFVIKNEKDRWFNECWNLYLEAFPDEERRSLDYLLETLACESFHLDAIIDRGSFIGFVAWWSLADFSYIEYLATSPKVRGGGYGKMILEQFAQSSAKPILLEVEHPDDEIKERRINFYKRLGYKLNKHSYAHPPYDISSDEYLSLLVMTYPNEVSVQELERFKSRNFPIIHFRHTYL